MTVAHDEKEFLALLQPFSSDETRKARRNTSTIGFAVIATWALGIRLNDIRVMGVDISKSSESLALWICLALLAYWAAMFLTSWLHDREIEKERRVQGQATAEHLVQRHTFMIEQIKDPSENGYVPAAYHDVKRAFDAYERQRKRTANARRYEEWIRIGNLCSRRTFSYCIGDTFCGHLAYALTVHSSRTRFASRLNSDVRRLISTVAD